MEKVKKVIIFTQTIMIILIIGFIIKKIWEIERCRDICILINAYNYPDKATNILINSIRSNTNLNILIVSHGKNTRFQKIDYNIYNLQVVHNSIDFTALIAVVEHQDLLMKNDFLHRSWFYLHNTTKFGKSFNPSKIRKETCKLKKYPSMNIGTYLHQDLIKCKDILLDKKSSNNPSKDEIKKLKIMGIGSEDCIFKYLEKHKYIGTYCKKPKIEKEKKIYSDNVLRRTEYYKELDLYKYKANWGQRNNNPILSL